MDAWRQPTTVIVKKWGGGTYQEKKDFVYSATREDNAIAVSPNQLWKELDYWKFMR